MSNETRVVLLVVLILTLTVVTPVVSAQSDSTATGDDGSFQTIGEQMEIMFIVGGLFLSLFLVFGFVWWLLKLW